MTRQASPSPPRADSDASMPETVRDKATGGAASAAEQAGQVTEAIGEQAQAVVSETGHQARQLLKQGASELRDQARAGQQKVAGGLRDLADQFRTMSERTESGMASDVVRQVAERASGAASWLESREPGDLVGELRNLARRRPGMFLAGSAFAGVLVGRLTRNMVADAKDDGPAGELAAPADGITAPGLTSTSEPGYAATSGYAPPVGPADPESVTTEASGYPGTGPVRS